jgi:hypothetical protein
MTKTNKNTPDKSKKNLSNVYKISALVIIIIIALYFILINVGKSPKNINEEYMFRKDGELTFLDSTGKAAEKLDIQVAKDEFDRELGLMFRKGMEENQGMLFIFPDVQVRSFWMRNTEIPLDMLFISESSVIINIAKNTTPYSDASYASTGPAKYVLEVNGGFADRHDITPGMKVEWTLTH